MSISRIFDCVIGKSVKCESARRAFGISSIFYTAHSFPLTFRTWFAWAMQTSWIPTGSNCFVTWTGATVTRSTIRGFHTNTTGKRNEIFLNISKIERITCNSKWNGSFLLVGKYFQRPFHRGNIHFHHSQNHVYKCYLQGTTGHHGHNQIGKIHQHNNGQSSKCPECNILNSDLGYLGYI